MTTDIRDFAQRAEDAKTHTAPPSQALENHVSSAIRGERLYPSRTNPTYWHLTCLRRQMEEITARFLEGHGRRRLVDFGCGNMPYRPVLEAHVDEYLGVDLPGNDVADVFMKEAGRVPLESGTVDCVVSSQVLEHVADPVGYLLEARRLLGDDGVLILTTHGVWPYHPDPTDYWRWTSAGLRKIVEEAGFDVEYFRGIMGPASTALQLWQDSVRVRGFFRPAFWGTMQLVIRFVDLRCPDEARDEDAGNYAVVAKKR